MRANHYNMTENSELRAKIDEAKRRLPMPELMKQLGLDEYAKKSARCPFHQDKHNSFSVWEKDGRWFWKCHTGCGGGDEITFLERHKGISRGEAIRLFVEMAGVNGSQRIREHSSAAFPLPSQRQASNGEKAFNWQQCISGLKAKDLIKLGNERWYSRAFCGWLHEKRLVGLYSGGYAFPVQKGTGVAGTHYHVAEGWRYHPAGTKTQPFVIGDLTSAKQVHLFESQWDLLALADRTDLYQNEHHAFIATCGAKNAGLLKGLIPAGASVLVWPQNDAAGQKWLTDLCTHAGSKVAKAVVPPQYKDLNEWTKAGANAEQIYQAFWRNELFKPEKVPVSSDGPLAPNVVPSAKLQGSEVLFPDLELWPYAVNGAEVLKDVADTFLRYAVVPEGASDAIALWCAYAHRFEAFPCSPRLYITSPEKGCGKTTVRDVIALFVPRPLLIENVTVAVLFRLIQKHKPTLLADECDAWLRENEELRGILNAGHRRGGKVYRCEGDGNEVRGFDVYAPVVLVGLGKLPGTLFDRSIVIRLDRATKGELQARFDSDRVEKETELCRKVARFIADNAGRLEACDPKLPDGAFNRLADNWRPLFAIAEIAGGDWPQRVAVAFAKLTTSDDMDAQGIGTTLLADIRQVFEDAGTDKLSSATMCDSLAQIEGREWAEWGRARKPISTHQLAKLLCPFKVFPQPMRVGGESLRGYLLSDFTEAFARYLPEPLISDCNSAI
jgi:putative DNA primase/helicase